MKAILTITAFLVLLVNAISAQNVGIGTDTPDQKLEVAEDGNVYIRVNSLNDGAAGVEFFSTGGASVMDWRIRSTNSGNLYFQRSPTQFEGFGTQTPVVFSHDGKWSFGTTTPVADFEIRKSGAATKFRVQATNFAGQPSLQLVSGINGFQTTHWKIAKTSNDLAFQYGRDEFLHDSIEVMRLEYSSGFVGIGTDDPQAHLDVAGDGFQNVKVHSVNNGDAALDLIRGVATSGTDWRMVNDGGILKFLDATDGFVNAGTENVRITQVGNVGINTESPSTKLHISGGQDASYSNNGFLQLGNTSGNNVIFDNNEILARNDGAAASLALQHSGGNLHLVNGGGNVGIGMNSPTVGIHVEGKDMRFQDATGTQAIYLDTDGAGSGGEIRLYNNTGLTRVEIEASETSTTGAAIKLRDSGGKVTVEMDADFGGVGRVITDEIQIKGGADLSENFDVSNVFGKAVEAGQIVSIDVRNPGQLILSSEAYDTRIAGVISGANGVRPGLLMGQEGTIADGAYPIALTGRVYVKVDASFGEIKAGDLITSSPIAGVGMKAKSKKKRQGAIIGKAMTELSSGQGEVLVLISLQ